MDQWGMHHCYWGIFPNRTIAMDVCWLLFESAAAGCARRMDRHPFLVSLFPAISFDILHYLFLIGTQCSHPFVLLGWILPLNNSGMFHGRILIHVLNCYLDEIVYYIDQWRWSSSHYCQMRLWDILMSFHHHWISRNRCVVRPHPEYRNFAYHHLLLFPLCSCRWRQRRGRRRGRKSR